MIPAQADAALLGQVAIELEDGEAPGIGRDVADPAFKQIFEIAIRLLQMMRPQE